MNVKINIEKLFSNKMLLNSLIEKSVIEWANIVGLAGTQCTFYEYCITMDDIELVKTLIEKGAPVFEKDGVDPLRTSISFKSMKCVYFFLEMGCDPNLYLNEAIESCDENIVEILLERKVNLNSNFSWVGEKSYLIQSVTSGNKQIIKLLFDRIDKCDYEDVNNSFLNNCYNYDHTKDDQSSVLTYFFEKSPDKECIQMFIDKCNYENIEDYLKTHPLQDAIGNGVIEDVKFLIEAKTDVNITNRTGNFSALYTAVAHNKYDICKYLIGQKTRVNFVKNKVSILEKSVRNSCGLNIIKLLLKSGADTSLNNFSVIIFSILQNRTKILKELLNKTSYDQLKPQELKKLIPKSWFNSNSYKKRQIENLLEMYSCLYESKVYGKFIETDCPICMESMIEYKNIHLTECEHAFCKRCWRKYRKNTCPLCRQRVS